MAAPVDEMYTLTGRGTPVPLIAYSFPSNFFHCAGSDAGAWANVFTGGRARREGPGCNSVLPAAAVAFRRGAKRYWANGHSGRCAAHDHRRDAAGRHLPGRYRSLAGFGKDLMIDGTSSKLRTIAFSEKLISYGIHSAFPGNSDSLVRHAASRIAPKRSGRTMEIFHRAAPLSRRALTG